MLITSRHSLHGLFGGRGEQWHNINIHTQQLTKTEALSLCPLDSRIPCLSLLQELEQAGSPFVLAAVWYKAVPTPIASLHKKNTHRSKLWLEKFTAGWGKSQCSCNCWADIQPVFHSSALSFGEYLRTGHVQAYKGFFFSGLKGRYEYQGEMGLKDIFQTASHPNVIKI